MEPILLAQGTSPDTSGDIWQFNQYIFGQEGEGGLGLLFSGVRAAILQESFSSPGDFISAIYPILLTFGGLIFFIMLIWGAFQILMGGANPKSVEGGKKRVTYALVGLLLLFASFWIGEIVQAIFGLNIGF